MHFLITAGPTREYLDPVRFISNPSSGKMGLAVGRAALARGHQVTLVIGPIQAKLPKATRIIQVQTASQMAQACFKYFPRTDCLVMAAAVCDYKAVKRQVKKIKKCSAGMTLQLKPTIDILAELGRRKKKQLLIGFALETDNLRANALAKLRRKKLDYIIVNTPKSLASQYIKAAILSAAGEPQPMRSLAKLTLARKIVALAEKRFAKSN